MKTQIAPAIIRDKLDHDLLCPKRRIKKTSRPARWSRLIRSAPSPGGGGAGGRFRLGLTGSIALSTMALLMIGTALLLLLLLMLLLLIGDELGC